MIRITLGLVIMIIAVMIHDFLGPVYWSLSSMLGLFLFYQGLNRYVQARINPPD